MILGYFLKLAGPHFPQLYRLCMPHTFVLRVKRDNAFQQLAQSLAPGKCPVSATSCFGVIVFIIRKSLLSSSCQLSLNISPVLWMSRASYSIRLSVSLIAFVDLCLFVDRAIYFKKIKILYPSSNQ